MPLHQWKYLTWNHFLSLDSHTLFFPLFITYFDIQVHLTIFYTYFYYTQITVPLSNKTSQGPILPSPNYMTHTKTSISIIPRYPNILVLAYPIHHLYHSIPLTPIPMTPNFNQMHSFYTKLLLTLNTRSITTSTPSALSPTSPGGQLRTARRCVSSGTSQIPPAPNAQPFFPSLRVHTKLIPPQS